MKKRWISYGVIMTYIGVCLIFIGITYWGNRAITVISQNAPLERKNCIIIDAGHGYPDGGTTSVTGVLECSLNLQIAQKTNAVLNLLGIDTLMLRETENSVYTTGNTIGQKKISDIHNRVNTVNAVENAMLISIHQNYFNDSQYRGTQVFYADDGQSKEFAGEVQQNIVKVLQPDNHRHPQKSKGVYLMEHIHCTGILVECGFLSNPEEDALLSDSEYQKKIAGILAISAVNYLDRCN